MRRVALVVTVVGAVGLLVLAWSAVPWQPVPGGTPVPVPAESIFTATEIARAEDYARWARVWSWSSLAVSLVVVCALGFGPWGRRLAARLPGPWWVQVPVAVAAVELTGRLVTLPFAVLARRHVLAHGLSEQAWSGFALDLVKREAVTIVGTSLVLLVLVGCARRWRRAWPAVAAALLGALVLLGSFAYPLVVEPLFNSFTSLPDGELRAEVFALAEREGVPIDDVLVADASRRTTTLNAYVSGFGGTRRVVLYDTLVAGVPGDQALSVIAHELAHAKHDDVLVGSLLGALGAAVGVGVLGLVLSRPRTGVRPGEPGVRPGEPGVRPDEPGRPEPLRARPDRAPREATDVPLLLALFAVASLLATPVQSGISRQIETRADVTALQATADPDALIALQRSLALRSLADPTPPALAHWWFGTHPGVLQRIAIAERLRPD